jgi:hypothetical protein
VLVSETSKIGKLCRYCCATDFAGHDNQNGVVAGDGAENAREPRAIECRGNDVR